MRTQIDCRVNVDVGMEEGSALNRGTPMSASDRTQEDSLEDYCIS